MSTELEVSKEEAAVISAALLAYLGKPPAIITPAFTGTSKEDVEKIIKDFYVRFKKELLEELEGRFKKIEDRFNNVEKKVSALKARLEKAVEEAKIVKKAEVATVKSSWSLPSRYMGLDRNLLRYVSKSSSFWSFVSKIEKQVYQARI
ncbi:MAG: hypothetical protein ACKD6N_07305 [Candidatus Bathyarchaeota archaeon]